MKTKNFTAMIDQPNDEQIKELTELLNQAQEKMMEHYNDEIQQIMDELKVSEICASNIRYLRTRNRWNQTLEERLIQAHQDREEVNIFEFGVTEETMKALIDGASEILKKRGSLNE